MLARDGYLEIDEIKDIPGYPGTDVLSQKKCVVVECSQKNQVNEQLSPQNKAFPRIS